MTNHIWLKHNPGQCPLYGYCPICDGGLGLCTVCGGAEGSLTKECCGFRLHETVLEAVYKGGLNFEDGKWAVAESQILWFKDFKKDKSDK